MMVLEDLKDQIPLREISRISGISLSGYYYRPRERHVERLDRSINETIRKMKSMKERAKNPSRIKNVQEAIGYIREERIKGPPKEFFHRRINK